MKKAIFAICATFALLAQPLAAQSALSGFGSEMDLFMLPNWAYLVAYDDVFAFLQGVYAEPVVATQGGDAAVAAIPGVRAGFGKKTGVNAGLLHFYFAGTGFALSDYAREAESAAGTLNTFPTADNGGNLTLQFDTLYSDSKFGAIKLGLGASGIGSDEDLTETSATDYTRINYTRGTFTPSLEYGKNYYHEDGSMWTWSLGSSLAIPFSETVTETVAAGVTTTTTDTSTKYTTWSITPTFAYVFKPKVTPVYTIFHIYLSDAFGLTFFPEHLTTTEKSDGTPDGWTARPQSYMTNNFFGYLDAAHYISTRFSISWRFQYGFYTIFENYGNTEQSINGVETETKVSDEQYTLWPYVGGWIGFAYQAIPSFLTVKGTVSFPSAGANTASWYYIHNKTTDEDNDLVTTWDWTLYPGFFARFSLGANMMLNSNVSLELATMMDTDTQKLGLNNVSLTLKYRR